MAAPIDEISKSKEAPIRFQPVAKDQRQLYGRRWQEVRNAREQRQQLEAAAADAAADASAENVRPVKVKLPKTPIVSQPVERFGEDEAPPQAIEAPQPDSKVEPKRRKSHGYTESPPEPKVTNRESRSEQPKVEPKERPKRERTEAPKGGSDDRAKGGSKGSPEGKGKKKK